MSVVFNINAYSFEIKVLKVHLSGDIQDGRV